jgi:hypothetical protein
MSSLVILFFVWYGRAMTTIADTIKALGGAAFLARQLGVTRPAVYNWKHYGAIPPRYYLAVAALAEEKKVYLDKELFKERTNGKSGCGPSPSTERG